MTKSRKLWLKLIGVAALAGTLAGGASGFFATYHGSTTQGKATRSDTGKKHIIEGRYIKHLLVEDIGVLKDDGSVAITITNAKGAEDQGGPGICIYQDGTPRLSLDLTQSPITAPVLNMYNAQGAMTTRMTVLANGHPAFLMQNPASQQMYFVSYATNSFRTYTGKRSELLDMARMANPER